MIVTKRVKTERNHCTKTYVDEPGIGTGRKSGSGNPESVYRKGLGGVAMRFREVTAPYTTKRIVVRKAQTMERTVDEAVIPLGKGDSNDGGDGEDPWRVTPEDQVSKRVRRDEVKYLMWNAEELKAGTVRRYVSRYGEVDQSRIVVKRIRQPNGERRHDVTCPELSSAARLKICKGLRVRMRKELPPQARALKGSHEKPSISTNVGEEIGSLTFNINGYWKKKEELFLMVSRTKQTIVALQETLRRAESCRSWIPRYQVIERPKRGAGARGILLGVRRGCGLMLSEYEATDWFVSGRVTGKTETGTRIDMVAYSVYIPIVKDRKEAKERLCESIRKARGKGFDHIMVMGDLNMDKEQAGRYFSKCGIRRIRMEGDTRERNGRGSTLDYVGEYGMGKPFYTRILDRVDLSDHFPVLVSWNLRERTLKDKCRVRFDATKVSTVGDKMKEDARWEGVNGSLEKMTTGFIETVWEIAEETQVKTISQEPKWRTWMSKKTLSLIRKRREYFRKREDKEEYERLWKLSMESRKADKQRVRMKKVQAMNDCYVGNRYKELWKLMKDGELKEETNALIDKEGKEVNTREEIEEVWVEHFGRLASDKSGNSRSKGKWKEMMASTKPKLEGCSEKLEWKEVTAAIRGIRGGKAAGWDMIPVEVFKLVEKEEEATSRLAQVVWRIISKMWKSASVPEKWNKAVIVPVWKKGDKRDPQNYRGISLIPVMMKIYSKVLTNRLTQIVEGNGILVREQAGFRSKEECVAQATALYEVVARRLNEGKETYGVFIDFAKAYDKVPHEGMLRKLRRTGIKGRLYKCIRSLYKSPTMCVKSGSSMSRPTKYLCGVRQGCPISPLLFNLYINDLLEGMKGVEVLEV